MAQTNDANYISQLELWHQNRENNLKKETGWLTVSGLFWLEEGENTFGSAKENKIVFPEGKADLKIGSFILLNDEVRLTILPHVVVKRNDTLFNTGIIFSKEIEEQSVILEHKKLRWFIIKRGKKYAIRLRDLESDARLNFTHIDRFPVDEKWKINATFEAPKNKKTIPIHDVIGNTTETEFGGTLKFEIDGKPFSLDATLEGADDLFIVFGDYTNGVKTYGAGRFLYAKKPKDGNNVVLDFNKAYNPPCAFTDFATCPLPPDQNKLSIEVLAGELKYGNH
ncbi:MAG TPA: DUF1684 domain-containing protein [Bacteroidia bacterium]|nr:DUF1684 domain-containing protein [Bacteroidia bacterium]